MFEGLIVLELSNVLAGPSVGMFFAELGAKVIKVENLSTFGDVTRTWKTPNETDDNDISSYFGCANWGKQSICVDLKKSEGKKIIRQLAALADVIISSYKAGDAEKLGVDYESLCSCNPTLIYASINGYGDGNTRVAYDAVLQAETSYMFMNGEPNATPLKLPIAIIDVLAAHQLKEAILLALLKKAKNGEGSYVSVSLYQAALSGLVNQASNYLYTGNNPKQLGSKHPNIAPYGDTFLCKDQRFIILAVGNDKQFEALCNVLNITMDAKYANNQSRLVFRNDLIELLANAIKEWPSQLLTENLHRNGVPVGIVRNMQEALEDKAAKGMVLLQGHQGAVKQIAFKGLVKNTTMSPPPALGNATKSILQHQLGYTPEQIENLMADNVILAS
jgi:crotonobetainyl-CoA:carnitine CoA-transferase CaiB-like acyl-CoA transferase